MAFVPLRISPQILGLTHLLSTAWAALIIRIKTAKLLDLNLKKCINGKMLWATEHSNTAVYLVN
jgi:hypothetical protein